MQADRQTDTQTDRHTDRQAGVIKQTEIHTDKLTKRDRPTGLVGETEGGRELKGGRQHESKRGKVGFGVLSVSSVLYMCCKKKQQQDCVYFFWCTDSKIIACPMSTI